MPVNAHDVTQLSGDIWGGMLQMELMPDESTVSIDRSAGAIGACVQITGAWEGAVQVECSLALACSATARFLGIGEEEVVIDQVRDAMGELANMCAGSVKPLLPSPSQLSLPAVTDGCNYNFSVHHGELMLRSGFRYGTEPLLISILQRRAG